MLGGQLTFQLGDLGYGYSLDIGVSADSLGKHKAIEMFGSQITIDATNQDFSSIGNAKLAVARQAGEAERVTITLLHGIVVRLICSRV
jgi:stress response protein SCP2